MSVAAHQMVILDIPDSGAFYVYDGDVIDTEMIRTFIGPLTCLAPMCLVLLVVSVCILHVLSLGASAYHCRLHPL